MRTIPSSKRSYALLLAATAAACTPRAPDFRTVEALPSAKPVQREGAEARAGRAVGETGERPTALTVALGEDEVLEETRAFLRAAVARDPRRVLAALADEATFFITMDRPAGQLAPLWIERLRRLAYDKLATVAFVDRIEVLDVVGAGRRLAREDTRPPWMMPGDLYVRVHFAVPRVGGERLFGDELGLLFRKSGDRARIVAAVEDFSLP